MRNITVIIILLLFASVSGWANDRSAQDVIQMANQAINAGDSKRLSKIRMTVLDGNGEKVDLSFVVIRLQDPKKDVQRLFVYFDRPVVSELVYVVKNNIGMIAERPPFFPDIDSLQGDVSDYQGYNYVGSSFVFEDVSIKSEFNDRFEFVDNQSEHYYIIKGTPKNKEEAEYDHYFVWVNKKTFLPVEIEYYNREGTLSRLIEVLEIKNIEGFPTVTKSSIIDLKMDEDTFLHATKVRYLSDVTKIGLMDAPGLFGEEKSAH